MWEKTRRSCWRHSIPCSTSETTLPFLLSTAEGISRSHFRKVPRTAQQLVAGATLYLPVFKQGALFNIGDAHAGMGDGEVCLTAMETAMDQVVLKFTVRKDMKLTQPMAETPTHYILMAYNPDLNEAAKDATRAASPSCRRKKG